LSRNLKGEGRRWGQRKKVQKSTFIPRQGKNETKNVYMNEIKICSIKPGTAISSNFWKLGCHEKRIW